jgi:hypothetical protein
MHFLVENLLKKILKVMAGKLKPREISLSLTKKGSFWK